MDMKTISVLRPVELFEVVNKLQNMITNETGLTQFIQFAKNMEEMRKKWQRAEERLKELQVAYDLAREENEKYVKRMEELKLDVEMHYERRMKAENERDKLQKQIEMFKKILEDKQSYTLNDEDRNFLLTTTTPNHQYYHHHNTSRRQSHNNVDETGSLISDYTEDDLEGMIDNDDMVTGPTTSAAAVAAVPQSSDRVPPTPQPSSSRKSLRTRRVSPSPNKAQNTSRSSKRAKGSLTRQDDSVQKRSRTRSHDGAGGAITAITTLKLSDDGRPLTLTSEIQHGDSPLEQASHKYEATNGNNKLEVSFVRPKTKKKRPSREFLQRSADESESCESEAFWSTETATKQNIDRRLLTPIVETPAKSKENITGKHGNLKNVNSSPLIVTSTKKSQRKQHTFKSQVTINSEFCSHCDKRTRFGKMVYKCRDCDMVVHPDCKDHLERPCLLPVAFPLHGTISDYVSNEAPYIPQFLQHVITEIEARGIGKEVGLYRVNGSDTQIKQFKERLCKRHQLPDLRRINDVHVLCGFVKEFLNNLNEHLITYDAWPKFARACDIGDDDHKAETFKNLVYDLPRANRDTLAYMILHLQRVSQSSECKMGKHNLACVLGPSIVGNSALNMLPAQIIPEVKIQHQILENLITLPSQFYDSLISVNDVKLIKNAPNTPELLRKSRTATVLSSLLGPAVNSSSQSNQQQQQTQSRQQQQTLETPSSSTRDIRNIRRNYINTNTQQQQQQK